MLLRIHLSKSCKPKTCRVSDWRLDLDWLSVTILKLAYITDTVCDCMHYSWAIWQKNRIMMIFFQFDWDVSQYISDRWLSLSCSDFFCSFCPWRWAYKNAKVYTIAVELAKVWIVLRQPNELGSGNTTHIVMIQIWLKINKVSLGAKYLNTSSNTAVWLNVTTNNMWWNMDILVVKMLKNLVGKTGTDFPLRCFLYNFSGPWLVSFF